MNDTNKQLEALGFTVEFEHNAKISKSEGHLMIKFDEIRLKYKEYTIRTPYSLGMGHMPKVYSKGESGLAHILSIGGRKTVSMCYYAGRTFEKHLKGASLKDQTHSHLVQGYEAALKITPFSYWQELIDVSAILYSLTADAMNTDCGFEYWCEETCFNNDSIKAKEMFETCRDTGDTLRLCISEEIRDQIGEILQDY